MCVLFCYYLTLGLVFPWPGWGGLHMGCTAIADVTQCGIFCVYQQPQFDGWMVDNDA